MLAKRIIQHLDVRDGQVTKGHQFQAMKSLAIIVLANATPKDADEQCSTRHRFPGRHGR